jgi:hypothetical protein
MGKDLSKPKVSKLVLSLPKDKSKKEQKELQRTDEWQLSRLGRWTGSQLKNIMTCSASGGRLTWNDKEKIFHIGAGVLKYTYENAMERKSKRYIDSGDGTKEMKYGTHVEPLILFEAKKLLKEMKVKGKVKEVGFKQFPTMPNAGVSSDSILIDKKNKNILASLELKACTSWGTHFDRTFDFMDDKGKDFWQTQGQMMAWSVDVCYYAVAQPPQDIATYLYHQGDVRDLQEQFGKECKVTIQKLLGSKIHQHALLKRICICEKAINDYLKDGGNLRDKLYESVDYYKQHPDEMNIYIK